MKNRPRYSRYRSHRQRAGGDQRGKRQYRILTYWFPYTPGWISHVYLTGRFHALHTTQVAETEEGSRQRALAWMRANVWAHDTHAGAR